MSKDPNESYWKDYDGLQHVKHMLLERYLSAWFPILSKWHGKVLYVDCNAGRGRHESGQEGSPILAIRTLLNHRTKNSILNSTQVNFVFFENNATNFEILTQEIASLGTLPKNIFLSVYDKDYESELRKLIKDIRAKSKKLAPSFVFVDPFSFKLSMNLLNDLLQYSSCELFINFMYHFVDLSIHNLSQATNMDTLFGTSDWLKLAEIQDPHIREEKTLELFANQLNANFVTSVKMLGENNTTKYVLMHATNHPLGKEKIKDTIWSVFPDGNFVASVRNNPQQMVLLTPEPNLTPLRENLWENFVGKNVSMNDLYAWLLNELYRKPHLHKVLTEYRKQKIMKFNGDFEQVAFSKNPTITFPFERQ